MHSQGSQLHSKSFDQRFNPTIYGAISEYPLYPRLEAISEVRTILPAFEIEERQCLVK